MLQLVSLLVGMATAFLNGVNMPWNQCGNDYGQGLFDRSSFENAFGKYQNDGSNLVRLFIHYNGCKQYNYWDSNGAFKPLGDDWMNDFVAMLDVAKSNNLQVLPSLWSFECVDCDHCREMLTDSNKASAYMNNGLGRLIDHVAQAGYSEQVYAWEIMNEPEWMIDGTGGSTSHTIPLNNLQSFMKQAVDMVHSKNAIATIGSASLKWSCNQGDGCAGNWWGASGIDFYEVHYYDWMVSGDSKFDPYTFGPDYWGLDKGLMVGEAPGSSKVKIFGSHTCSESMLYDIAAKVWGYVGNAAWADKDSSFDYSAIAQGLHCMEHGWPQDCLPDPNCLKSSVMEEQEEAE